MKWVALGILLFILPYTWLTLHYRKPGPAYQPYEDLKSRANVERLLSAGFQRIPLAAERPADAAPPGIAIAVTPAPGGLPAELRSTLVGELPLLPSDILRVQAEPTAAASSPYPVLFTCAAPNDHEQLSGAELYVHGTQLILMPTSERIGGNLLTRSRESTVRITVPPRVLKPGRYDVTLVGEHSSRTWSLAVR